MEKNNNYENNKKTYGEIRFENKNYALTEQAYFTNRVFTGWWGDAKNGESYISEYTAHAIDHGGNAYMVVWQFTLMKNQEPEDEGALDWNDSNIIGVRAC